MTSDNEMKSSNVFKEEEETEKKDQTDNGEQTGLGLEPNIAGLLCYLFGFISGLIFFLIEKENRFVRFHAMQSIIMNGVLFAAILILTLIPFIGWIIGLLAGPLSIVLWIFMMFKAYKGEWYKLPYIGDFAEQQIDKAQN